MGASSALGTQTVPFAGTGPASTNEEKNKQNLADDMRGIEYECRKINEKLDEADRLSRNRVNLNTPVSNSFDDIPDKREVIPNRDTSIPRPKNSSPRVSFIPSFVAISPEKKASSTSKEHHVPKSCLKPFKPPIVEIEKKIGKVKIVSQDIPVKEAKLLVEAPMENQFVSSTSMPSFDPKEREILRSKSYQFGEDLDFANNKDPIHQPAVQNDKISDSEIKKIEFLKMRLDSRPVYKQTTPERDMFLRNSHRNSGIDRKSSSLEPDSLEITPDCQLPKPKKPAVISPIEKVPNKALGAVAALALTGSTPNKHTMRTRMGTRNVTISAPRTHSRIDNRSLKNTLFANNNIRKKSSSLPRQSKLGLLNDSIDKNEIEIDNAEYNCCNLMKLKPNKIDEVVKLDNKNMIKEIGSGSILIPTNDDTNQTINNSDHNFESKTTKDKTSSDETTIHLHVDNSSNKNTKPKFNESQVPEDLDKVSSITLKADRRSLPTDLDITHNLNINQPQNLHTPVGENFLNTDKEPKFKTTEQIHGTKSLLSDKQSNESSRSSANELDHLLTEKIFFNPEEIPDLINKYLPSEEQKNNIKNANITLSTTDHLPQSAETSFLPKLINNVQTLVDTIPSEMISKENTPREAKETTSEMSPRETTSREATPRAITRREKTPRETTPREMTPRETTSIETTHRETTPRETDYRETAPRESNPRETIPCETTHKETAKPKETNPWDTTPKETVPRETTPWESPQIDEDPLNCEEKESTKAINFAKNRRMFENLIKEPVVSNQPKSLIPSIHKGIRRPLNYKPSIPSPKKHDSISNRSSNKREHIQPIQFQLQDKTLLANQELETVDNSNLDSGYFEQINPQLTAELKGDKLSTEKVSRIPSFSSKNSSSSSLGHASGSKIPSQLKIQQNSLKKTSPKTKRNIKTASNASDSSGSEIRQNVLENQAKSKLTMLRHDSIDSKHLSNCEIKVVNSKKDSDEIKTKETDLMDKKNTDKIKLDDCEPEDIGDKIDIDKIKVKEFELEESIGGDNVDEVSIKKEDKEDEGEEMQVKCVNELVKAFNEQVVVSKRAELQKSASLETKLPRKTNKPTNQAFVQLKSRFEQS